MGVPWPSQLQQKLDADSFSYKMGDTVISSDVDQGPVKKRRRFTRGVNLITCSIVIDYSLVNLLETYVQVTLNGGLTQFEFVHPFKQVLTNFRLAGTPEIRPLGSGGTKFKVSMQWEEMP